jgi:hypothetical protein
VHLCLRIAALSEEQQREFVRVMGGHDSGEFTLNFALLDDATIWFAHVYVDCCLALKKRRKLLYLL